jgi:hypothetical protein
VAIIQISRIQQRRGQTKQTGFPQLASGEFGWSIDTQELKIGNGAVSEGAPAVGNTRILTENDTNFFLLSSPVYLYGNTINGPTVQTGPNNHPNEYRLVQDKLDDHLNFRDFGGVGDEATDNTAAFQRMLNYTSSTYKIIDIPEGTFVISDTIYVPPFTEIRGAGVKTVIKNLSTVTSTIFQTVDGNGNQLNNLQSGGITPQHIRIDGVTFWSTLSSTSSILVLDGVQDSLIQNCIFVGDTRAASSSTQSSGVLLRGYAGGPTCDSVSIQNCLFQNISTAILSNDDIQNIRISENKFNNLNRGILFANRASVRTVNGPTLITITDNIFENINYHGIYVGSNTSGVSIIKSSNNTFTNIGGGNYLDPQSQYNHASSIISFNSFGNMSSEDSFSRLTDITASADNIAAYPIVKPLVNGPMVYNSNVSNAYNLSDSTSNNTGTTSVFIWPKSTYIISKNGTAISSPSQTISVNYSVVKFANTSSNVITREGTVDIVVNGNNGTFTDTYQYNGANDGGVTFNLDTSRNDVIILKLRNTGSSGTVVCSAFVRQ